MNSSFQLIFAQISNPQTFVRAQPSPLAFPRPSLALDWPSALPDPALSRLPVRCLASTSMPSPSRHAHLRCCLHVCTLPGPPSFPSSPRRARPDPCPPCALRRPPCHSTAILAPPHPRLQCYPSRTLSDATFGLRVTNVQAPRYATPFSAPQWPLRPPWLYKPC